VLLALCVFDPELRYCQGLSFLVGTTLLQMDQEASFALSFALMQWQEAFWMLVQVLRGYGLRDLYLGDLPLLHRSLYTLDRLMEYHAPRVFSHFVRVLYGTRGSPLCRRGRRCCQRCSPPNGSRRCSLPSSQARRRRISGMSSWLKGGLTYIDCR
jgi:hypothetical protein